MNNHLSKQDSEKLRDLSNVLRAIRESDQIDLRATVQQIIQVRLQLSELASRYFVKLVGAKTKQDEEDKS